jgi:CheY-like chemotaxis protein
VGRRRDRPLRPHIRFLEQRGYAVTAVRSGEDALSALSTDRFDVILLDEMMPGMGGLATLDAIHARELNLPVVLITKSEEETLMEEAIGKRITDYLIKPVNPSQVYLACKRVLDTDRLQESRRARDYAGEMQRWHQIDTPRLDWEGWKELAIEVARWDVRFDELHEEGLQQAHLDFRRTINIEFGRFIETQYGHWVHGAENRPLLSTDVVRHSVIPHLQAGRRVVFIVIDCMRLDQWFTLEPLLDEYFDIARDYYCSILPTATPYSRNAIFSGLLPAELREKHPDLWQENSNDERIKNRYERQLMDFQLARMNVTPSRPVKYLKIYDGDEATRRCGAARRSKTSRWSAWCSTSPISWPTGVGERHPPELAPDEAAFRTVMKAWSRTARYSDILRALVPPGLHGGDHRSWRVSWQARGAGLRQPRHCPACANVSASTSTAIPSRSSCALRSSCCPTTVSTRTTLAREDSTSSTRPVSTSSSASIAGPCSTQRHSLEDPRRSRIPTPRAR